MAQWPNSVEDIQRHKRQMALRYLSIDKLDHMVEQYLENPASDLPFAFQEVLEEISRRILNDDEMEIYCAYVHYRIRSGQEQTKKRLRVLGRRQRLLKRVLIPAMIFLLVTMAAYAVYPSLFSFSRDSEETIVAERNGGNLNSMDENAAYPSLEAALSEYGLERLSPTWIPAGFGLQEVQAYELENVVNIVSVYADENGKEIMMLFTILSEDDLESYKAVYEVDSNYQEYRSGGATYFIDSNFDTPLMIGEHQDCIFRISGDVSEKELKQIVDSILR